MTAMTAMTAMLATLAVIVMTDAKGAPPSTNAGRVKRHAMMPQTLCLG